MLPLNDIHVMTNGKWAGILREMGIPSDYLRKKHGPCPMCGGKDRFRFDDKEGRGTWYCSQCGAGDGFSLLEKIKGWGFRQVATEVSRICGHVEPVKTRTRSIESIRGSLNNTWDTSRRIRKGDPVDTYLTQRGIGLDQYPSELRCHRKLSYFDGKELIGKFPAMVGRILDAQGKPASLHRTYLKDGQKAPVDSPKKVMEPIRTIKGGAIRLFPVIDTLAVAEGIETALAVYKRCDLPVWATISAGGMESLVVPAPVREILIFADNDANGVGQKAANALASRMRAEGRQVEIYLPTTTGNDWLDEFTHSHQQGVRENV